MPYLYIHNPTGHLLLFGHILNHVLGGLENSMAFGKWISAPLRESMPRLRYAEVFGIVSVP